MRLKKRRRNKDKLICDKITSGLVKFIIHHQLIGSVETTYTNRTGRGLLLRVHLDPAHERRHSHENAWVSSSSTSCFFFVFLIKSMKYSSKEG